jgi:hypothetical protein
VFLVQKSAPSLARFFFWCILPKNLDMYPLLVQGIYSNPNGGQRSLLPAANIGSWNNAIKIGRGNLIAIDPISTNITAAQSLGNTGSFNYNIGGQIVYDTAAISNYAVTNKAGQYQVLPLKQPGGQSVSLNYDASAGSGQGVMIHHYFENKFNIPAICNARFNSALKPRIKSFNFTFSNGQKIATGAQFSVPTGLGNVVAIEVFTTNSAASLVNLQLALFTVSVGGTTIFEDANAAAYCAQTHKPNQVLPILIRPGETFTATADTSDIVGAGNMTLSVKLYFDDDFSGTRKY